MSFFGRLIQFSWVTNTRLRLASAISRVRQEPNVVGVTAVALVFAVLYAVAALVEHRAHRTALIDLGIYDQALRAYANFDLPYVPLFGVRSPDHPGLVHWTDHFTPILVILAPLYWVHDGPETLLVAQAVLFALAIPPLWIFTRRALGSAAAYLIAITYAFSWPIQHAVWTPFHQVSFAVPLLAAILERYQAERYRQAAWLALALLGVREDLGLVVSVFGILLLTRGIRRLGLTLAAGGVTAVAIITSVVIPLVGGSPRRNWTYWHFGRNPVELVETIIGSPIATLEHMLTPAEKVRTLLWLFAPLLFLSLRSRLVLLALPLLAIRMLSSGSNYWGMEYHYNAFVIPILMCAAVDGARRLPPIPRQLTRFHVSSGLLWALVVCMLSIITLPRWPGWSMTHRDWWYPRTPDVRSAEHAIEQIPDGAFVAAANHVGIHVTRRTKVILWVPARDRRLVEAVWRLDGLHWTYVGDRRLAEAPWVLADIRRPQFPFRSVADQAAAVTELSARGYRTVYRDGNFVVLHRAAP